MKLSAPIAVVLLLAPATCRVVPAVPRPYLATNITTLIKAFGTPLIHRDIPALGADSPPPKRPKLNPPDSPTPAEPDQPTESLSEWSLHVCRGEKLTRACKLDQGQAESFMLPISTDFKGTLKEERKLWGYTDASDPDCDIDGNYYDISRAYEGLNILDEETLCFRVYHYDDNQVDDNGNGIGVKDQTYKVGNQVCRVTGAHGTFGINVDEGAVFYIDVASASLKAAELWGVDKPSTGQLPALRQMSDLSWGFWYEAHGGSDLGHITKFVVPQVINDVTLRLIDTALESYDVPDDEERPAAIPEWPGITFDIDTDAGKALLGSPNGIAAAYFLSQHKQEIGGNKYVQKITVFRPDEETDNDEPTIVYYVANAPVPSLEEGDPQDPEQDQGLIARHTLLKPTTNIVDRRKSELRGTQAEKASLAWRSSFNNVTLSSSSTNVSALAGDDDEAFWTKYVCRGERLHAASIRNKDAAISFVAAVDSEFDGTMEDEMKTWGYTDEKGVSMYCGLEDIAPILNSLGIDPWFKKEGKTGGENACFHIEHTGSLGRPKYKVDGKTYRKTGAYAHIGINARDGVVSFLNVRSAEKGAIESWKPKNMNPDVSELPRLRQISDITWAFWNRAHIGGTGLNNINNFLVHDIINPETKRLMRLALKFYHVPEGEQRWNTVPRWPGLEFDIETPEGKAMLGSPNGLAAGYFLIQHKSQLGGNKYVYKATFWSDYDNDYHMLLWVKDAPPPPQEGELGMEGGLAPDSYTINTFGKDGKIVKRSIDGKNFIREHVVIARL